MIEVEKEGIILTKTDLEFENEGVLNPQQFAKATAFIFHTGLFETEIIRILAIASWMAR